MILKMVSIALATFNGEKYLSQQIDSILSQTFKNIEIIISDDNSSDNTYEIIQNYALKYSNIKVFKNQLGAGFVRNFENAISKTTGKYIALADQDDVWFPNKLELLLKEINGFSLVFSNAFLTNSELVNNGLLYSKLIKYSDIKISFKCLLFNNIIPGCFCLFDADLKKDFLPIPKTETYHDWYINLWAAKRNGIKFLNMPLMYYRRHDSNFTQIETKSETLLVKIFNTLINQKDKSKINKMRIENINRLKGIINLNIFNDKIIKEVLTFNENYINTKIHFKTFYIALKYSIYIHPNYSFLMRFLISFKELFH